MYLKFRFHCQGIFVRGEVMACARVPLDEQQVTEPGPLGKERTLPALVSDDTVLPRHIFTSTGVSVFYQLHASSPSATSAPAGPECLQGAAICTDFCRTCFVSELSRQQVSSCCILSLWYLRVRTRGSRVPSMPTCHLLSKFSVAAFHHVFIDLRCLWVDSISCDCCNTLTSESPHEAAWWAPGIVWPTSH